MHTGSRFRTKLLEFRCVPPKRDIHDERFPGSFVDLFARELISMGWTLSLYTHLLLPLTVVKVLNFDGEIGVMK